MAYLYLAIAIISEITATMTLKATHSFTRFWPSVIVVASACCSLFFFSLCVRTLNVAVVYSVWSGIGLSAVTLLGWMVYGQKLDAPAMIGIGLIAAGVIVMSAFSQTTDVQEASESSYNEASQSSSS